MTILLFLGFLVSLPVQNSYARVEQNGIESLAAKKETPGFIDDNFRPVLGGAAGAINRTLAQPDGKILVAGNVHLVNGANKNGIARFNPDGTLDETFNTKSGANGSISALGLQSDGKIIIGGVFTNYDGQSVGNIARLNADGSFDASFNPGTGASGGSVTAIAVQTDGKILIGGNFTSYDGAPNSRIARLNADGSFDSSFVVGTGASGEVSTITVQADGRILIGGFITTYNTVTTNHIARLNTDGSIDSSFAAGTGASNWVRKIAVQPDGKIIVAGDFAALNSVAKRGIIRLNADGSDDTSFNTGTGLNSGVTDFVLHADGKTAIVGGFTSINGTTRNRVARLNADGSLDTSFDPGAGFSGGNVNAIAATEDGKYLVGGVFSSGGGVPKNKIARLRSNGSFDHKFLSGLGPFSSNSAQIRTIVPYNGKYLIGGQFEIYNTSPRSGLLMMSSLTKAPVDYDGDGKTDIAIVRHYGGFGPWTYWIKNTNSGEISTFDFGIFTVDVLQPGDYDGDGKTDIAIWRARAAAGSPNGYWIISSSTNQVKFVPFGLNGDAPMVEDYDGDGKDDMSTWRVPSDLQGPGQATWFYQGSYNNPNGNITYVPFGMRYGTQFDQKDKAIPGDFDGDGKADFRVGRRVDTSVTTLSTPGIFYTLTADGKLSYEYFGWAGDRYLPGDYDGDGKTDIAIVRGFNITPNTTTWFIRYTGGAPDASFPWGAGGLDQFAPGDYDGDGITDITVYRRANENNYYIRRSSDLSMMVVQWGTGDTDAGPASDLPAAFYRSY